MRPVAPLAKKAGLPLENLMASLGVLRTRQFRPEMAGTAIRNIIAILNTKPTAEIEGAFKKLGLTWAGVKKEFEDTKDIIGVMRTLKTAGLDLATGLAIFGREAGPAALALSDAGAEAHDLETVLKTGQGTADKMRKMMSKGLPGAVDQLKSAFEGLQLTLGAAGITGALERVAKAVTNVTNAIGAAPPELQMLMAGALLAGPVLLGVGAALKALSFALGGLLPLIRAVRFAMFLFGLAMLTNPFFLIVAAIAAVAAGIVALIYHWDDVTAAIRTAWDWLAKEHPAVFQWIKDAWNGALQWISTAIPSIFQWVKDAWSAAIQWISVAVPHAWAWLKNGVPEAFKWVKDAWNGALQWISVAVPSVFQWVDAWKTALMYLDRVPAPMAIERRSGLPMGEGCLGWRKGWVSTAAPAAWAWLSIGTAVFQWVKDAWCAMYLDVASPFRLLSNAALRPSSEWVMTHGTALRPGSRHHRVGMAIRDGAPAAFQWVKDAWDGAKAWSARRRPPLGRGYRAAPQASSNG